MDPCVSCSQEFYIVTLTSCLSGCLFVIQNSSRNYRKGLRSDFEMHIFGETEHQQNNFGVEPRPSKGEGASEFQISRILTLKLCHTPILHQIYPQ